MNSDDYLDHVFRRLDAAAAESLRSGSKWPVIDCACEHLADFLAFEFPVVLDRILALIERYPTLDYGGPGPFGSYIEEHPMPLWTPQLQQSLRRQPSVQVLGWLDRTVGTEGLQNGREGIPPRADYAALLRELIQHPLASDEFREFATLSLESPER